MFEEFMTEIVVLNVILITIVIYLVRKLIELNSEFNQFKSQKDNDILEARKDSNKKQRATIKGQITETIAPWSMTVVNSVSELNFLGNPIDFIGFKGLDGDGDIDIKFIEVKSGKSKLNTNQRRIRDAVKEKRIDWVEVRISEIQIEEKIISG
jgi:predicted Holliday junction resolvase-like endonuclease|tara:strand:- start:2751 stop:3209 length:459 start_codon:yes stop_codon:yes gene_type:complete